MVTLGGLEWKNNNINEYIKMKGERRLCDLTTYELNKLYEAIKADKKLIKNEQKKITG